MITSETSEKLASLHRNLTQWRAMLCAVKRNKVDIMTDDSVGSKFIKTLDRDLAEQVITAKIERVLVQLEETQKRAQEEMAGTAPEPSRNPLRDALEEARREAANQKP